MSREILAALDVATLPWIGAKNERKAAVRLLVERLLSRPTLLDRLLEPFDLLAKPQPVPETQADLARIWSREIEEAREAGCRAGILAAMNELEARPWNMRGDNAAAMVGRDLLPAASCSQDDDTLDWVWSIVEQPVSVWDAKKEVLEEAAQELRSRGMLAAARVVEEPLFPGGKK